MQNAHTEVNVFIILPEKLQLPLIIYKAFKKFNPKSKSWTYIIATFLLKCDCCNNISWTMIQSHLKKCDCCNYISMICSLDWIYAIVYKILLYCCCFVCFRKVFEILKILCVLLLVHGCVVLIVNFVLTFKYFKNVRPYSNFSLIFSRNYEI